jgi:CRP/FNR family transcriptional regulator, cyclic AMP receptor protein
MERFAHASLPLAHGLDGRAAFRLFALAGSRLLIPGQVLFREDPSGPAVHLVASGALVSELTDLRGRSAVVAVLRRGDLFGEVALVAGPSGSSRLADRPRSPDPHMVRALITSRVLSFPGDRLRDLLAEDNRVAWWFNGRLLERLHRTETLLARRMSLPLAERVLEVLLDLMPPYQASSDPSGQVPVTQELLAALVGTTRESVNRVMRRLVREGKVRRWGRCYLVTTFPDSGPDGENNLNGASSEGDDRSTLPSISSLSR